MANYSVLLHHIASIEGYICTSLLAYVFERRWKYSVLFAKLSADFGSASLNFKAELSIR